jgi:hypothetical protein
MPLGAQRRPPPSPEKLRPTTRRVRDKGDIAKGSCPGRDRGEARFCGRECVYDRWHAGCSRVARAQPAGPFRSSVGAGDRKMAVSDAQTLKDEIKRLSARAMQLKMDLHDLSEELPQNWQQVLTVAQKTYDAFALLEQKRGELAQLDK